MLSKTTRYTRHTYGDNGVFGKRNIVSTSFSATDLGKASATDNDAILAATAGAVVATPTGQPSVPRNLIVVTAGAGAGTVTITGRNSEGSVITEDFVVTAAGTVTGTKAFASVTSIDIPAGVTPSVGTGARFGVNQRVGSTSVARLLVIQADGTAALEEVGTGTYSDSNVENNLITPTTTPNGVLQFRLYILNYNWHVDPTNGQPSYGV